MRIEWCSFVKRKGKVWMHTVQFHSIRQSCVTHPSQTDELSRLSRVTQVWWRIYQRKCQNFTIFPLYTLISSRQCAYARRFRIASTYGVPSTYQLHYQLQNAPSNSRFYEYSSCQHTYLKKNYLTVQFHSIRHPVWCVTNLTKFQFVKLVGDMWRAEIFRQAEAALSTKVPKA